MPEIKKPAPGTFCWVDCNTSDPAAAKKFYGAVLGWEMKDMPMPDGSTYTMATYGGKQVAGIMRLPEEAAKTGAKPMWLSYVAVDDVDASTKKAESLGGRILKGPVSMGPGKMSILADPTGAVFSLWRAEAEMGTFLHAEDGALAWNELSTPDVDRAGKFYVNLFGWKAEAQPAPGGGGTYTVFKVGDQMVGGMMAVDKNRPLPTAWGLYFAVPKVDEAVKKAKAAGAKIVSEPFDVPMIGRMGFLIDPQGAAFSLGTFLPPQK
jgi:uncharacterized protein